MMKERYNDREPELYKMGLWLGPEEPAGRVAAFSAPSERARNLARYGYAALQASRKLSERFLTSDSSGKIRISLDQHLPELRDNLMSTSLHEQCPLRGIPRCRVAARRYRTSDGTCNNLEHPWRGSTLTPAQRFLSPNFDDGLESVRRSITGETLPSARDISIHVHRNRDRQAAAITLMLMQWGQFVDHDITSTAQSRAFNGSVPRCCTSGGREFQPPEFMHPDCLPIPVSSDDWFLSRFGVRCMEFVRSAPAARIDCHLGWREQINQVTSFLDASTMYGSTPEQTDSLRLFRGGQLQYGRQNPVNPPDPPGGELCRKGAITTLCMRSADGRASEQPALTALHIVWVRQHNRLAEELTRLNPHWSDEKVFQETRRIIGAMVQHITYREFLPVVLGMEVLQLFDLEVLSKGYYNGYNPKIQPTPTSSFTTAAFRFGHSLVQSSFVRSDTFHRPIFNNVSLHEEQLNAENIWSFGSVDRMLLGLVNQPSQTRDEFITDELTNHLFQSPGFPFGMDLAAINIQRGRDHGLPPYVQWRVPCGLSSINNFTDLHHVMSIETANRFRSLYFDVRDIDLFSGGMAERPVRGGLVGPTFACIIAQQFHNLRKGDRFWYENEGFESSFTPAQLQQIRKVTLAEIICENAEEVSSIQRFVFMGPDEHRNRREDCRSFQNFDLTPWLETSDEDNGIRRKLRTSRSRDKKRKTKPPVLTIDDKSEKHKAIIINLTETEDARVKAYYSTNYYTPDYIPNRPTHRPKPQTNNYFSTKPPRTTKRPNAITLLVNNDEIPTSTQKPNYNVNIQINYYYNGTKPIAPTVDNDFDQEPFNPNPTYSYGDSNVYSHIPEYNTNKQTVTLWSNQGMIRPSMNPYQSHNTPIRKVHYNVPSKYHHKEPYVVQKSTNKLAEIELKDILDLHMFDIDEVPRPDEKKYIKISSNKVSIRGKTTDDDSSFGISNRELHESTTDGLANKDNRTDDLEMTYSEVFEQFAKPEHNETVNSTILTDKDKWTIYNVTQEENSTALPEMPLPETTDDEYFSVELPKPLELFDEI